MIELNCSTSHRGNLCFQNKACCSGRSMWLICSLVKMINGFAPSQEGKALLLGNCHPAANCQWAVKVNTCPPSLQAAHWLVIAIAGCCGLSHGWSLWVSTFWDQSEQRYIHLTDTLPSFFLKRHALLVFESWIHLRVSRTSWWSLGEQQALLCVSSVGGPGKTAVFPCACKHCRKSLNVSPRAQEAYGHFPKPCCKPVHSYGDREVGSSGTPDLFVSYSSYETGQFTLAPYYCHVLVI